MRRRGALQTSNRSMRNPKEMPVVCRVSYLKSKIRNLKSIRGFTLIEILIFIVIAGILLPAIVVPFATAVKGSRTPERVATAMYLAQQKMEEMMKYDYARSPDLDPIALSPYADIDPANFPNYRWQKEILRVDSNFNVSATDRGYKRILVRVRDPENTVYEIHAVVTNFP